MSVVLPMQRQRSAVESVEAREGSMAQRQWKVSMNWGVVRLVVQLVPVRMQRSVMELVDMIAGLLLLKKGVPWV